MIKLDEFVIEPLNEAFGQNIGTSSSEVVGPQELQTIQQNNGTTFKEVIGERPLLAIDKMLNYPKIEAVPALNVEDTQLPEMKLSKLVTKESGPDIIRTIVARDVEQGMCSQFRRLEVSNEKRSINEPKFIPVSLHSQHLHSSLKFDHLNDWITS